MKKPSPNILVTIAARGGSKGIKDKNIRPLLGSPLIAYTIKQALSWGRASHVVVTTDSKAIADVARSFGAEVPFIRPAALATDSMGKLPVIRHALTECEKIFKERFDIVVDLDVTAPLRTVADLENCLKLFEKKRPNTVLSVVEARKNPYFNVLERTNGRVKLCKKRRKDIRRRQDAPQVYDANASIYFYERNYLLKSRNPLPVNRRTEVYVMPEESGFDIDREVDFKFVEFLVKEKMVCL